MSDNQKRIIQTSQPQQFDVKSRFSPHELPLSELSQFISGQQQLRVPVYTVWGACEDVRVLEKIRSGEYKIPNLHLVDESSSALLEIGGVKLRLLGLGGAVVMHKLFDNGEGLATIAGGQGTMWTTLLQMGELIDTAARAYDPSETRVFITHACPAREGLLNQLAVALKADFSISAGLHFRYGSSYNEFSVNPTLDHYRGKLAASKASFNDVWETVRSEVEPAVAGNDAQNVLLQNALEIVNKMPAPDGGPSNAVDESAFKNMWNFNLADAAFGYLVMELQEGRIATEMRAQGFNFAHRTSKQPEQRSQPEQRNKPLPQQPPKSPQTPIAAPETKDRTRLYLSNIEGEAAARESFGEADRPHIVRVETLGGNKNNHVVQFSSHEAADAALQQYKGIPRQNGKGVSGVRWYLDQRPHPGPEGRQQGGTSGGQPSAPASQRPQTSSTPPAAPAAPEERANRGGRSGSGNHRGGRGDRGGRGERGFRNSRDKNRNSLDNATRGDTNGRDDAGRSDTNGRSDRGGRGPNNSGRWEKNQDQADAPKGGW